MAERPQVIDLSTYDGSFELPVTDITFLGDGQLAYLTGLEAKGRGLSVGVVGESEKNSAGRVADVFYQGDIQNAGHLMLPMTYANFIALDTEHVAARTIHTMQSMRHGLPGLRNGGRPELSFDPEVLMVTQNKTHQHMEVQMAGVPMPRTVYGINSLLHAKVAAAELGNHGVLQTGNAPYDGRGNELFEKAEQVEKAYTTLEPKGNLFMEQFVPFDEELAVHVMRGRNGEVVIAPPIRTMQVNGQLYFAECRKDDQGEGIDEAISVTRQVSNFLPGPGLITVELFRVGNQVLYNEACVGRRHNSAHLTMQALENSQGDQIVRMALGEPIGSFDFKAGIKNAMMVNLIGAGTGEDQIKGAERIAEDTGVALYDYGKQNKDKRKVGHVTAVGTDGQENKERLKEALTKLNEQNNNGFKVHSF